MYSERGGESCLVGALRFPSRSPGNVHCAARDVMPTRRATSRRLAHCVRWLTTRGMRWSRGFSIWSTGTSRSISRSSGGSHWSVFVSSRTCCPSSVPVGLPCSWSPAPSVRFLRNGPRSPSFTWSSRSMGCSPITTCGGSRRPMTRSSTTSKDTPSSCTARLRGSSRVVPGICPNFWPSGQPALRYARSGTACSLLNAAKICLTV